MYILPTPAALKEWQIWHYQKRLNEETNPAAKRHLKRELFNLKNQKYVPKPIFNPVCNCNRKRANTSNNLLNAIL